MKLGKCVKSTIGTLITDSLRNYVSDSVWDSVRDSVGSSIWLSIQSPHTNINFNKTLTLIISFLTQN
jgi:hypothetical protein